MKQRVRKHLREHAQRREINRRLAYKRLGQLIAQSMHGMITRKGFIRRLLDLEVGDEAPILATPAAR